MYYIIFDIDPNLILFLYPYIDFIVRNIETDTDILYNIDIDIDRYFFEGATSLVSV